MKLKYWAIGAAVLMGAATVGFHSTFIIPEQPEIISIHQQDSSSNWYCHQAEAQPEPIDNQGQLDLLVWNIYKQAEPEWQQALTHLSQNKQLILLQEARLSSELKDWVGSQEWGASYVNAFKAFGVSTGVLNLASQMPIRACAYTNAEPWIMLPKSALYARYPLSNGQDLVVINAHAINFTIGTKEFEQQIEQLKRAVQKHEGPLIVAGDFNTWSETRLEKLRRITASLSMKEVAFTPDYRKVFFNDLPFDHVFYRDLIMVSASSPTTSASDHSPLLVSFRLE